MNRPPTPDVADNLPEREPTFQELLNIKVFFFLFSGFWVIKIVYTCYCVKVVIFSWILMFGLLVSLLRLERRSGWWNFWGKDLWIVVGRMKWNLSAGFVYFYCCILRFFIVLGFLLENNFRVIGLFVIFINSSLMDNDMHYQFYICMGCETFSFSCCTSVFKQYFQSLVKENNGLF